MYVPYFSHRFEVDTFCETFRLSEWLAGSIQIPKVYLIFYKSKVRQEPRAYLIYYYPPYANILRNRPSNSTRSFVMAL